jgi:hypothetical protein
LWFGECLSPSPCAARPPNTTEKIPNIVVSFGPPLRSTQRPLVRCEQLPDGVPQGSRASLYVLTRIPGSDRGFGEGTSWNWQGFWQRFRVLPGVSARDPEFSKDFEGFARVPKLGNEMQFKICSPGLEALEYNHTWGRLHVIGKFRCQHNTHTGAGGCAPTEGCTGTPCRQQTCCRSELGRVCIVGSPQRSTGGTPVGDRKIKNDSKIRHTHAHRR